MNRTKVGGGRRAGQSAVACRRTRWGMQEAVTGGCPQTYPRHGRPVPTLIHDSRSPDNLVTPAVVPRLEFGVTACRRACSFPSRKDGRLRDPPEEGARARRVTDLAGRPARSRHGMVRRARGGITGCDCLLAIVSRESNRSHVPFRAVVRARARGARDPDPHPSRRAVAAPSRRAERPRGVGRRDRHHRRSIVCCGRCARAPRGGSRNRRGLAARSIRRHSRRRSCRAPTS